MSTGVPERDDGFNATAVLGYVETEPVFRLDLGGGCGQVFGLYYDRRTAGRRDQDVRAQARMPDDRLGVLGTHVTPGQHALEAKCPVSCLRQVRYGGPFAQQASVLAVDGAEFVRTGTVSPRPELRV